jgi:4-hydroxy-3-methylbut-2-enyl diphosphate reductase IspH
MELERDSRRQKCKGQIIQYWYHILCLDTENLAKQFYQWQKSNMSVRSWTTELREELHNIGIAFMRRNQQECNFKEMTQIVKELCNAIERQNIFAKMSKKG